MEDFKIDLLGLMYDVEFSNGPYIDGQCGKIMHDFQKIFVNNTLAEDTQKLTIIHEIFHKILYATSLERSLLDKGIDTEVTVEFLSSALFNIMMSNKSLFYDVFLREELKADAENLTQSDLNNIKDLFQKSNKGKCGPG